MNSELRAQLKRLSIISKRLSHTGLTGDYLSAFKGRGMEFYQLREYQVGDDVRFIDWKSSMRYNKTMVKQYIEERDRCVIIMIDISSSMLYASTPERKQDLARELASVLTLTAIENNDKVGLLLFADKIYQWLPPKRGMSHATHILEMLLEATPRFTSTNIEAALKHLISLKMRNAIVFCISDWIDMHSDYTKLLRVTSIKYDFIVVRVLDEYEHELPDIGFLETTDLETGQSVMLDARSHTKLSTQIKARLIEQKRLFDSYRIDMLDLMAGRPFIHDLAQFFHLRTRRSI